MWRGTCPMKSLHEWWGRVAEAIAAAAAAAEDDDEEEEEGE